MLNRSAPPLRPPGARDIHPPPRRIGTPARVAFLVAVAAGLFGRLYGLGGRPLAVDEYYFLSSIQAILQHGLPLLPGGGYYTRGLLLQYLTAPFVMVLDDPELALRLPAVLFGLGTVAIAWVYGRRVLGPGPALLLCGLLLVSSWEIEFSRFGRMYAGFQFFALAFVASLHAALEETRGWRLLAPPLLLAGALLSHELAIFMVPLVLLPLVVPGWKRFPRPGSAWLYALTSLAVTVSGVWFWRTDFRHWGVRDRFPGGYVPTGGGSALTLPSYPFWSVADDPRLDLAAALAVVLLAGALAAAIGHRRGRNGGLWAVAGALLASAVLHQLAVTAVCVLLLVAWFGYFRVREREAFVTAAAVAGTLVAGAWVVWSAWLTFVIGDRSWIAELGAGSFRAAFFRTFAWPDPYPVFVESWGADLPLLGSAILAAIVVQVVTKLRRPPAELASNPGWVLVYFFLALGVTDPFFSTTRYTHFLYPIGLTVLVLSSVELARLAAPRWALGRRLGGGAVGAAVVAVLFAASADFNPAHIVRVGTPDVAFRQGAFQRFEELWYARRDYASPGRYVQEHAQPGDTVIVVDAAPTMAYLDLPHALYLARGSHEFDNVSRASGTMDFWSGRRLLSTPEELCRYTARARRVWLVRSANPRDIYWMAPPFEPEDVWGGRITSATVEHRSVDDELEVLRVDLGAGSGLPCPASQSPGAASR